MLLLFLVFVLALGPQVVLSDSFKFSFSEVQQCEPLSISFKGALDPSDPVPVTLTVLPFNGTAVSIPIPNGAMNTTGLNVTFLPFQEGSNFIASLDDSTGDNVVKVSDIVRVTPSGNSSCSLQSSQTFIPSFTVLDPISQCENFSVRYENGIAPTVRLYFPKFGSTKLNMISNDVQTGTATYVMTAFRQSEVVLMFNDTIVAPQTSALLSVQGDTSSSTSCFPKQNNMKPDKPQQQTQSSSSGVSKSVAIGLGVGFGILFLLAIPMIWYVIRERRRNRKVMNNNEPAYLEKSSYDSDEKRDSEGWTHSLPTLPSQPARPPAPPPFFSYNTQFEKHKPTYSWDNGFVKDPPYVSDQFSPTISDYPRSSISWEMVTPEGANGVRRQNSGRSQRDTKTILPSSGDLERMLDVAGDVTVSRNNSLGSRASRDSDGSRASMSRSISRPPSIPTRTRSRTGSANGSITFSASGFHPMNPIQDVPQNVSFLAETAMDDSGLPIFHESPMSMGSPLHDSRGSIPFEHPNKPGSRFSITTAASDDSVGQIVQVHLQRPPQSASASSDGHGLGSNSSFRFPPTSTYSPSPLAKALSRESSLSMESWGNAAK